MYAPGRRDNSLLIAYPEVARLPGFPHEVQYPLAFRQIEIAIHLHAAVVGVRRHGIPYAAVLEHCQTHHELATWYAVGMDILVNNAGLMGNKFELSKDGFEYQYAANFLGHFLLTGLLLPLLNQTESARIVSLASIAHRFGKININKINQSKHYYPFGVYSNTKLACLLFSNYLSKKLADKNVKTIAVAAHPGISITNISHKLPEKILKAQHFVGKLFMSNQVEGAESIVMASLDLSVKNGDYIGPSGWFEIKGKPKKVKCTSAAKNWDKAEELWAFAEKATNISY